MALGPERIKTLFESLEGADEVARREVAERLEVHAATALPLFLQSHRGAQPAPAASA